MSRRSSSLRSSSPTEIDPRSGKRSSRQQGPVPMGSVSNNSPDRTALLKLAQAALGTDKISDQRLEGALCTTYRLQSPDTRFCILRCPPPAPLRILRLEQHRLAIESSTLPLLSQPKPLNPPSLLAESKPPGSYTLTGPYSGVPATDLPHLPRHTLYTNLGAHLRHLVSLTNPTFGFPSQSPSPTSPSAPAQRWSRAFATLLEAPLRDAEDSLLSLPYAAIRSLPHSFASSLDKVTRPRLVLLACPREADILVDDATGAVTGLTDYGSAIWADPLLCGALYGADSDIVGDGFGVHTGTDDQDGVVRRLLYVVFHSLMTVVRGCLRPSIGSGSEELEARRRLVGALRGLGAVGPSHGGGGGGQGAG